MDDQKFNLTLRKFLKSFGITAQRDIERAVDAAVQAGTLQGSETLRARALLEIEGVDLRTVVEGAIELE